jgi:hypothetical protein
MRRRLSVALALGVRVGRFMPEVSRSTRRWTIAARVAVDALRESVHVVVGRMRRAGYASFITFSSLAHIEDLQRAGPGVLDLETRVACEVEVDADFESRIDAGCDRRPVVADEVGRPVEIVVGDLSEEHRATV